MAVDVPLLAIDSGSSVTYLANHDASVDYQVLAMRFPAPRLKPEVKRALELGRQVGGSEWHQPTLRTIELYCVGDDAEDALLKANDLYIAASRHSADLWTRHKDTHHTIKTTIRSAEMSEPAYDTILRSQYKARVTLSLTTDPYWRDEAAATDFSGTITNSPYYTKIESVPGEVPAITSITATCAQATSRMVVALEAYSDDAFSPRQKDFSGSTDISGSCVDSSCQKIAFTASDAWTDLGAASNIDVNAHRGTWLVEARVSTTSDASSTDYRVSDETTGNGIASTVAVYTDPVTATKTSASGAENVLFGPIVIPSGGVPGVDTGSGYDYEAVTNSHTTRNADEEFDGSYRIGQTFTLSSNTLLTAASFWFDNNTGSNRTITAGLLDTSGGVPIEGGGYLASGEAIVSSGASGEQKITFDMPYAGIGGNTYCVAAITATPAGVSDMFVDTDDTKSDTSGAMYTVAVGLFAWGVHATEDLYYKIHGRELLGFNVNVQLQGRCASGSQSGYIDTVIIYPTGYGCIAATSTFGANQGFLWDGCNRPIDRNVYLADNSGGIASSILDDCEVYGSLLLRPGSNTLVAGAHTPYNAVPGAITLQGTYTPRYITAGRGE